MPCKNRGKLSSEREKMGHPCCFSAKMQPLQTVQSHSCLTREEEGGRETCCFSKWVLQPLSLMRSPAQHGPLFLLWDCLIFETQFPVFPACWCCWLHGRGSEWEGMPIITRKQLFLSVAVAWAVSLGFRVAVAGSSLPWISWVCLRSRTLLISCLLQLDLPVVSSQA